MVKKHHNGFENELMNYNLTLLDSQHREAYDKCTSLLQSFMERQWKINGLYSCTSKDIEEKAVNKQIISFIQWVRYHLIGNDETAIIQKTNINRWSFLSDSGLIYIFHSRFACDILRIEWEDRLIISPVKLIESILENILPKRSSNSIFSMNENIIDSITLQNEVNRIREIYTKYLNESAWAW